MILIDFQGGAHGNYLEFVCNKFLAKMPTELPTPFTKLGSSHQKYYLGDRVFWQGHYSFLPKDTYQHYDSSAPVISIQITHDDLLPLSSISLLRAGDYNFDNDLLEVDTYGKLNIPNYRWVLDNIIDSFFRDQVKNSYDAVRDSSWPEVNTIDDFNRLPEWIRDECINVHGLELLQLDTDHPDCPRHVLREFFKIGFKYPDQSGFISEQRKMVYTTEPLVFPFRSFYDIDSFVQEIICIGNRFGYHLDDRAGLIDLHQQFLNRQPYKDSRTLCDRLINDVISGQDFAMPKLDLLQESYISAKLELHYGKEISITDWFKTSQDILDYVS